MKANVVDFIVSVAQNTFQQNTCTGPKEPAWGAAAQLHAVPLIKPEQQEKQNCQKNFKNILKVLNVLKRGSTKKVFKCVKEKKQSFLNKRIMNYIRILA